VTIVGHSQLHPQLKLTSSDEIFKLFLVTETYELMDLPFSSDSRDSLFDLKRLFLVEEAVIITFTMFIVSIFVLIFIIVICFGCCIDVQWSTPQATPDAGSSFWKRVSPQMSSPTQAYRDILSQGPSQNSGKSSAQLRASLHPLLRHKLVRVLGLHSI
jgi:hypothetical protein